MLKGYSFLSRADYFTSLAATVDKAQTGDDVIVEAMNFDPRQPLVARLMAALCAAASRGARVTLLVDAYNFLKSPENIPGPLFYQRSLNHLRGRYADTMLVLMELEAAGGNYCITNIPRRRFHLPQVGRSHIKGAVVGQRVFVGGCNLHSPSEIDVMVTWEDQSSAQVLRGWLLNIASVGNTREALGDVDSQAEISSQTRLLIDAGVPNQSLIYEEALRLIDEAKEWLFITCQFFPGGPTAKHLAAAQARGVRVEIDFSHPRVHGNFATVHHLHQLTQRTKGIPSNFFAGKLDKHNPNLHAKVLASESTAMVGSHNYVIQGVRFGTAELALHTVDPVFSLAITEFIKGELASLNVPITEQEVATL